jgi:starvation-inducible outer membrane lipoprotein
MLQIHIWQITTEYSLVATLQEWTPDSPNPIGSFGQVW